MTSLSFVRMVTCLESKLLETSSQTGSRLVSRSSLGHDGKLGGRAVGVAGSDLDAG